MPDLPKRIAIVYDSVNKWGGAEVVLLALHTIFPDAPLYTSVYDESGATWAKVFPQVIPSFLQSFPLAKKNREFFPWLTPMAFESFRFQDYDAVISVTSADAKGIITSPHTFHLCYCLTPTRYLWSHHQEYEQQLGSTLGWISKPIFNYLKKWDLIASRRPDAYIAISQTVQNRLLQYYQVSAPIVYPPVDVVEYMKAPVINTPFKDFFLYIGRLVKYKRPELVVNVFNQLNYPLVIIGTGKEEKQLKSLAKSHIKFTGFVSHKDKISYLQNCKAVIFFHEEDFGIVPVEAQAFGKPVIALNMGGASETVIHQKTGLLVNDASPQGLITAIADFENTIFDSEAIKKHSQNFSNERFQEEFVKIFSLQWKKFKNTYTF